MNTRLILPAIILGAASLGLSASVVAGTSTNTPADPVTGFFHATGKVVSGVGHATANVVGGVVHGTAHVVGGAVHTTGKVLSGHNTKTMHHQVKNVNS